MGTWTAKATEGRDPHPEATATLKTERGHHHDNQERKRRTPLLRRIQKQIITIRKKQNPTRFTQFEPRKTQPLLPPQRQQIEQLQ